MSVENEAVKAYWFLWSQLHIKNGVLYKLWEEETSPTGHWQLVLPTVIREQVMQMLHNHKCAGHLGQHKTLARVRMRFYWYKLKDDVNNWCKQCEVCAKKKMPIPKGKAKLQQHIVGCPLDCLFGVLRRFQHCTGHITTGSWKGRGNQYIEFARVVYCKLPTNGKQLPAFPLTAMTGIDPRPQRWEARVLPLCHRGPRLSTRESGPRHFGASSQKLSG